MELKIIWDDLGNALGHFGAWGETIDLAWQAGAQELAQLVSDGDWAIAYELQLVYGQRAPHQLCHCHLLHNHLRRIALEGWKEAQQLLASGSRGEAVEYAREIVALTEGKGTYWCRKALREDCGPWVLAKSGTGLHPGWKGSIESCDGGKRWAKCGRPTTDWHCSKSGAS